MDNLNWLGDGYPWEHPPPHLNWAASLNANQLLAPKFHHLRSFQFNLLVLNRQEEI